MGSDAVCMLHKQLMVWHHGSAHNAFALQMTQSRIDKYRLSLWQVANRARLISNHIRFQSEGRLKGSVCSQSSAPVADGVAKRASIIASCAMGLPLASSSEPCIMMK